MVERAGTDTQPGALQVDDRDERKLSKLYAQKPDFPHPLTTTGAHDEYLDKLVAHYVKHLDLDDWDLAEKAMGLLREIYQDGIEAAEFIV